MGNRANVVFHKPANPEIEGDREEISPCVYLHWNGGPESIYAFLDEMDRRKIRTTATDITYEAARFVHIVGDYFDGPPENEAGSTSLGLTNGPKSITAAALSKVVTDDGDNGFYVVTRHDLEGKRTVRRFVSSGRKLVEMSADGVEKERVEAYEHDYRTGANSLPEQLAKLRPNIRKFG
jgi:hypothetical protein